MRKAFLILPITLGIFVIASFKLSNNNHSLAYISPDKEHWGFVYFDPIQSETERKYYIGDGGFKDEATCFTAAAERLKLYRNPANLEVKCIEGFEIFAPTIIMA